MTQLASARLVPELLVTDIDVSLRFWRDLCGFVIVFDRLYEGFAYLDRDGARIMLEERGRSRNWLTGPMELPLGRGVNFEIGVAAIEPILDALEAVSWPLFMAPEEKWYATGAMETGVRQFLVQDPAADRRLGLSRTALIIAARSAVIQAARGILPHRHSP